MADRGSTYTMHKLTLWLMRGLLGIVIIVLWQWISGKWIEAWLISSPLRIAEQLWMVVASGEIWPHVIATVTAVAVGFPIGVISGIMFGYFMGRYRFLADLLGPYVMGLYGIPKVGFAPLFIIWFGIGISSKIALVMLISFFFNFFNTYAGVRYLDHDMIDYAQLLGAKGATVTFRVVLPAISPSIITGIRVSGPLAVTGAIVGEYIAARAGLGHFVRESSQMLDMTNVFVGVVFLVMFVQVMNVMTRMLEGRLLRWMPKRESGAAPRT